MGQDLLRWKPADTYDTQDLMLETEKKENTPSHTQILLSQSSSDFQLLLSLMLKTQLAIKQPSKYCSVSSVTTTEVTTLLITHILIILLTFLSIFTLL